MIGRLSSNVCAVSFLQAHMTLDVNYVCLNFLYSDVWFFCSRLYWFEDLHFEHYFRGRVPQHRPDWTGKIWKCLLFITNNVLVSCSSRPSKMVQSLYQLSAIIPSSPVFSYYSSLFLNRTYVTLLLAISYSAEGIFFALQFPYVAFAGLTYTFKAYSSNENNIFMPSVIRSLPLWRTIGSAKWFLALYLT